MGKMVKSSRTMRRRWAVIASRVEARAVEQRVRGGCADVRWAAAAVEVVREVERALRRVSRDVLRVWRRRWRDARRFCSVVSVVRRVSSLARWEETSAGREMVAVLVRVSEIWLVRVCVVVWASYTQVVRLVRRWRVS